MSTKGKGSKKGGQNKEIMLTESKQDKKKSDGRYQRER
jgi:hypothetical protein